VPDIAGEIEYIMQRAAAGETRLVRLAPLVFLSVAGSAWLLDAAEPTPGDTKRPV